MVQLRVIDKTPEESLSKGRKVVPFKFVTMIYKIPIYVEVSVEGDFAPNDLNAAVDGPLYRRVVEIVSSDSRLSLDSKTDLFDTTASEMAKVAKVKRVKVKLLTKTQVMKKIGKE